VKTPKNAVGTEQPPKIEFKSVEEVVLHFNRALGRLALITKQLDAGDKDEEKRQSIEREIKAIAEHLHQNVPAIQTQIDAQLAELSAKSQTALSEQSSQFAQLLQAESARIADSLTRELEAKHEQEKLMIIQNGEQSAQQRLSELEDRLHQSHQADLTVQAEQLQKQFDQRVQQLVDEERQGRLARLELLSAKLDLLERLTRSYVEAYGQASRLHRVWTAYFLARGAVESNDPQQLRSLRRHWTLLQELGKDEPLIETVLASIQSAVLDQGVPAMSELRAQFE
jgi:mitofilin